MPTGFLLAGKKLLTLHVRYYTIVYESHRVKVKVTGAKKGRKFLFLQCKISTAITPVL